MSNVSLEHTVCLQIVSAPPAFLLLISMGLEIPSWWLNLSLLHAGRQAAATDLLHQLDLAIARALQWLHLQ